MQSAFTNLPTRRNRDFTVPLESPTSQTSGTTGDVVDDDPAPSEYESGAEDSQIPPPAHTLLNEDPFSNETSKILFESIGTHTHIHCICVPIPVTNITQDELRRWGVGQDLELPQVSGNKLLSSEAILTVFQLVIVGKQSAGKSSLLQSLTDIPFPVGARLCTRFATRIVSRRTGPGTPDLVKASIEPGDINPFNYAPDLARLEAFEHNIPSITAEAFEALIEKVLREIDIFSSHAKLIVGQRSHGHQLISRIEKPKLF
jgi:hypothetical protein